MRKWLGLGAFLWLTACACDPGQSQCRRGCDDGALDANDANAGGDSSFVLDGGCSATPTSLVLSPNSGRLVSENGERVRQVFEVRAASANGQTAGGTVAFETTPQNLGSMVDGNTYEASGLIAGEVLVRATYQGCGTT